MDEKRCLYIVFTRTATTISRLINRVKHDKYTHASLALDRELNYMYSFGRKWARNPFIGKFKHEHLQQGLFKIQKTLPGAVLELEVTDEQYAKAKSIIDSFVANRELYKYNYLGLVHCLLKTEVSYENRFLCSEFVYHVLYESKILDLKKARNLVRPQDLYAALQNMSICRVIYEGDLKKFHLKHMMA
ncbi:MAG: hypothetical protein GX228_02465 [Firmicutes bacterium]|nr:hypothetical protein [Bacillota bacterium]NLL87782.1 hypothetical protein [Bacillota bacterium]HKM17694.1 hypothetical protein [Limnochordia bacterium]